MRALTPIILFVAAALRVGAADAGLPMEFVGVFSAAGVPSVLLRDVTNTESRLLKMGGEFRGHVVKSYDEGSNAVVLTKDGLEISLTLKSPRVGEAPATSIAGMSRQSRQEIWNKARELEGEALLNVFLGEANRLPVHVIESLLSGQATVERRRQQVEMSRRELPEQEAAINARMAATEELQSREQLSIALERQQFAAKATEAAFVAVSREALAQLQRFKQELKLSVEQPP